jgi:hypothetical protein
LFGLCPDLVRLRNQAARVEGHNVDRQLSAEKRVGDRLVFKPEAGGENNRTCELISDFRDPLEEIARRKAA